MIYCRPHGVGAPLRTSKRISVRRLAISRYDWLVGGGRAVASRGGAEFQKRARKSEGFSYTCIPFSSQPAPLWFGGPARSESTRGQSLTGLLFFLCNGGDFESTQIERWFHWACNAWSRASLALQKPVHTLEYFTPWIEQPALARVDERGPIQTATTSILGLRLAVPQSQGEVRT